MPARRSNARIRVGHDSQAIHRHGAGAVDDQLAGGVVEAEDVELGAGGCAEDVGQGDLNRVGEGGDARRLDCDVESVLQHARRQHVFDQFSRHGGNADLDIGQRLAVRADGAAGVDGQRQLLPLLIGQFRRGGRVVGVDDGGLGGADRLHDAACHTRQVELLAAGVGLPRCRGAHAAH